jgi:hypothetical protein
MMGGMGRQGMGQPMGRPDMSGTPPNMGAGQGRPQVTPPQETAPTPERETPPEESTADKATNFMKGLFGR